MTISIPQTIEIPEGYLDTEIFGSRVFIREEPTCELPDGLTGWYMRPPRGDCLQACVATILQRPFDTIPEELGDLSGLLPWADAEDLEIGFLTPGAGPRPSGLSIGVTAPIAEAVVPGARHTVVLRDGYLFFDPADRFLWPNGQPPARVKAAAIDHVITLKEKE
jgi:hypothetical protein